MATRALLHSPWASQVAVGGLCFCLFSLGPRLACLSASSTLYPVSCHHCHLPELFL